MIRIIGGTAGGRKLHVPLGLATRPTSDRVKENLFNIIGAQVDGAAVLDVYAGTGALAIEALSRGAGRALLVDDASSAVEVIEQNLKTIGFKERARVEHIRAEISLKALVEQGKRFDLIFLDPPYRINPVELELVVRFAARLLSERGLAVLEHRSTQDIADLGAWVTVCDSRVYGDTGLTFFKRGED